MQKKMSNVYVTQEIIVTNLKPDKIYLTNPSSNKIENFIKLLNPTTPCQIIRSFEISSQNYKLQFMTTVLALFQTLKHPLSPLLCGTVLSQLVMNRTNMTCRQFD